MTGVIRIMRARDVEEAFFRPRRARGVEEAVRAVINGVRERGDRAVLEAGARFDGAPRSALEGPAEEVLAAEARFREARPEVYAALAYSRDAALAFARKQRACFTDFETAIAPGVFTGQKNIPVERAGAYIPAGRFPLLSSAVMTLAPALAAGVEDFAVCTPPRGGAPDEGILAAVSLCLSPARVRRRVFAAGGAQAIAAMAYGTETVPRCAVIAGPGNAYVAEAKRQIYGEAGIDLIAGPTEVLVIADAAARADYIAADMLAQAEHDEAAEAALITDSRALAEAVRGELETRSARLPPESAARVSLPARGRIIIADALRDALALADRKAPEHLELAMRAGPERDYFARHLRNYGSLFIGEGAAEVLGDYAAGLNHTLPTAGAARYTGGLSVRSFLKTVTTLRVEAGEGAERALKAAAVLGRAEGLSSHAQAAEIRLPPPAPERGRCYADLFKI